MDYKTLMVHLEPDGDNSGVLEVAADLAARFEFHVIGIAACQPFQVLFDEGLTAGEIMVADRAEITREIAAAEVAFRKTLTGRVKTLEWRSAITYEPLASYIADEARAADLIITGPDRGSSLLDNTRRVKIGDLALEAGRPLLVVPHGVSALTLNNVFVGWKDKREARRALADALPLLKRANNVTVLELASKAALARARARVDDVARWLEYHAVTAEPMAAALTDLDAGKSLLRTSGAGMRSAGGRRLWPFPGRRVRVRRRHPRHASQSGILRLDFALKSDVIKDCARGHARAP